MKENRFYVYLHKRKDNDRVFYIGKGTGSRATRARKSKEWLRVCEAAGGYYFEILKDDLFEDDALALETALIKNPDKDWQLVNKVSEFVKPSFSKEEISEMFEYDETSPTCLRYRKWNNSRIKKTAKFAGDVAGYLLNQNNPPAYYAVRLNGKPALIHRLVWILFHGSIKDGYVINHKNGNSLDNRISNLEMITQAVNSRRTSKQRRESVGVRTLRVGKHSYSVASWCDEHGQRQNKLFSHTKLGEEEATRLAIEFRKTKIIELEYLGYKLMH